MSEAMIVPPLTDAPAKRTPTVYFIDDSGNWLYHTITTATTVTTPPITSQGSATLTVKAIAPLAVGTQGSFFTPVSQSSVIVTFAH